MKTMNYNEIDDQIEDLVEVDGYSTESDDEIIQELPTLGTFFTKKRLIRMYIRWGLTFLLYYYFWHITWVRWSLVIVAPMILFNLGMLLYFYWVLKPKLSSSHSEEDDLV